MLDAPAAGHAITFLRSARGLLDAVRVGPINAQARDVLELLTDPERCQVLLVTLPEETPVNELVETAYSLEDEVGVSLGPVVVNGLYPDLAGPRHRSRRRPPPRPASRCGPGEAEALADAAEFRRHRTALQTEQVARLADLLPLPQLRLPYLFDADLGPAERRRAGRRACSPIGGLPTRRSRVVRRPRAPLSSARSSSSRARSSSAPARAASARRPPPRSSPSRRPGQGRKAVRRHHRPGQAAGRRARPRGPDEHAEPDRGRLAGRALGADARHQEHVRRPRRPSTPRRPSRPRASWPTASTGTSPARCRARRSTWRWRSSTSCTTRPTSTSSSSTRRRPATPSTSSRRPGALTRFLDHRALPDAHGADPGDREGGQRRRPGVPAHGVEGGRRRRRRATPSPSSRPSTAWSRASSDRADAVDDCSPTTSPRSCSWPRPRRDAVEEATFFAEPSSPRPTSRCGR